MTAEEGTEKTCKNCGAQLPADANFCHKCGAKVISGEDVDRRPPKRRIDLERIYHVYSVVSNFPYKGIFYDNLKISWFVTEREKPQIPLEHAIANYSTLSLAARIHPEQYIMERFTGDEVQLLKEYLRTAQKISCAVDEVELPVSEDKKGYRSQPPGPGTDYIALYEKQSYNLPFKVEGIFNIKMADERVVSDDRVTVISKVPLEELKKHAKEKEDR
jgi:hypothetical protein